MATSEMGEIGMPWVVVASKTGKGLRVSKYQPGDDVDLEGDVLADIVGSPREMGRQIREILCSFECN